MLRTTTLTIAVVLLAVVAGAADVTLHEVTFPERKEVDLTFSRTQEAPQAELEAEVEYREGQALIDLKFRDMKPAILFGGEVTSYVLWAVDKGGLVENLGELWVRDENDSLEFSTGQKSFALMVTAERHPLVPEPSALVLFSSDPPKKDAQAEAFQRTELAPAPEVQYQSLSGIGWAKREDLDLKQAEKVLELAGDAGADEYEPTLVRRAQTALAQARNLSMKNRLSREARDYARRSVALSAEAIMTTERRKEAARLEAEIAARKAEMASLEARAAEAEAAAEAARQATEDARQATAEARANAESAQAAVAAAQTKLEAARNERAAAEAAVLAAQNELNQIEAEKAELESAVSTLADEKAELSDRLQGALAKVADTRSSARGVIVNLPDILFDTNESTLKPDAKIVIAKLAGILLIMDELNLRVEGHTDSTGSRAYNQELSEKRAMSVRDFLAQQGVDMNRMVAVGYGWDRPVASNDTREGRAQNRRVEIVMSEGTVAEAPDQP